LLDARLQLAKKRMRFVESLHKKEVEQAKERKRLREEAEQAKEQTKRSREDVEAKKRRNKGKGVQGWSSGGGNYSKGYGGTPWQGKGFQKGGSCKGRSCMGGSSKGIDVYKGGSCKGGSNPGNDGDKGGSCKGMQKSGRVGRLSSDDDADDATRWDGDDWQVPDDGFSGDEW
jgi:hypothetical protein